MFQRRHNAKGFTLLELLVTVALMGMMVGIVANVLSQSSKVVTFSETKIRQNNSAASLAQVLREYLRKASKNGILCITDTSAANHSPRLILTTVGTTASLTGKGKGDAAFTILGLVANKGSDAGGLLWMPTRILTRMGGDGNDIWPNDFSEFQGLTRRMANDTVINNAYCTETISNNPDLNLLKVPANTIVDVKYLWQVAATGVTRLSIQWTDGTTQTTGSPPVVSLKWYGRDINGNLGATNVQNPGWTGRQSATLNDSSPADLALPEFNAVNGGPAYRALWTQANQNSWPKAIKIRFTLTDTSMPPDFQSADYEVIGTIGQ